ncbi:translation initiation factor eIF-2B beta subunit [Pelomyxa schiedti]|nr:translation initiation factor eIF-2B beta subunit [Pelomyxa schiedti]
MATTSSASGLGGSGAVGGGHRHGHHEDRIEARIQNFTLLLSRRQIVGSFHVARHTAELITFIVANTKYDSAQQLIDILKKVARRLVDVQPLEFVVGNIFRRALSIIREETKKLMTADDSASGPLAPSLSNFLTTSDHEYVKRHITSRQLGPQLISSLNDLNDEIASLYVDISGQAKQHIHSNEILMVYGKSTTVKDFLVAAAKKRKIEVVVAEAAPKCSGQEMAAELAQAGISVTLISDSAVFAMMARMNKVIVGTHAVMANGGLVAEAGLHAVAVAAHAHNVPFVVCTGLYKLSPVFPNNRDSLVGIETPSKIIPFDLGDASSKFEAINPAFDYIPPDLVSLYLTNSGGHMPSYVYRLLAEQYDPEDNLL